MKHSFTFILGRALLGLFFVCIGIISIVEWDANFSILQHHQIPYSTYALNLAITAEILLGLLLIIGKLYRTAAALLIILTLICASIYLQFWNMTGIAQINTLIQFLSDIAIIAGLLLVIAAKSSDYSSRRL